MKNEEIDSAEWSEYKYIAIILAIVSGMFISANKSILGVLFYNIYITEVLKDVLRLMGKGAVIGLITLFINSFLISFVAEMMDGEAENADIRVLISVAMIPVIIGQIVSIVIAFALWKSGYIHSFILDEQLMSSPYIRIWQIVNHIISVIGVILSAILISKKSKFGFFKGFISYLTPKLVFLILSVSYVFLLID